MTLGEIIGDIAFGAAILVFIGAWTALWESATSDSNRVVHVGVRLVLSLVLFFAVGWALGDVLR